MTVSLSLEQARNGREVHMLDLALKSFEFKIWQDPYADSYFVDLYVPLESLSSDSRSAFKEIIEAMGERSGRHRTSSDTATILWTGLDPRSSEPLHETEIAALDFVRELPSMNQFVSKLTDEVHVRAISFEKSEITDNLARFPPSQEAKRRFLFPGGDKPSKDITTIKIELWIEPRTTIKSSGQ